VIRIHFSGSAEGDETPGEGQLVASCDRQGLIRCDPGGERRLREDVCDCLNDYRRRGRSGKTRGNASRKGCKFVRGAVNQYAATALTSNTLKATPTEEGTPPGGDAVRAPGSRARAL
jgi:hypothetical protein